MKIILDNAQHTPHLDIVLKGRIIKRLDICADGFLLNGEKVPKTDGIIIAEIPD